MILSLTLLFLLNVTVSIIAFFYERAFLHVSAHFTVLSCALVVLLFTEKVKKHPVPHMLAIVTGATSGFLFTLFQTQWRKLGELVFAVLNLVFPGASWLRITQGWLNELPLMNSASGADVSFLIIGVNVLLGCFFMWAALRFVELKGAKILQAALALAFLDTLAVGRLYFRWPPIVWGSVIYFGGAAVVGWMCVDRKLKKEELPWVAALGNLPWWLIGIGLGYRILMNPQILFEKASELSVSAGGIPVAVAVAVLLIATWAVLHTLIQWGIIRGVDKYLVFMNGKPYNGTA